LTGEPEALRFRVSRRLFEHGAESCQINGGANSGGPAPVNSQLRLKHMP
jgi:hypothetical protein